MASYGDYATGEKLTAANLNRRLLTWVNFQGTSTVTVRDSHNVDTVTDGGGVGTYAVTISVDYDNTSYGMACVAGETDLGLHIGINSRGAGSLEVRCYDPHADALADTALVGVLIVGDRA